MINEDKINSLDVSDKWKAKFLAINKAKPINSGWLPKFEDSKFRPKFNFLAFFFGAIYYVIKGMWKKALAILGLGIVLTVIVSMINPKFAQFVGFGIAGLVAMMANYDFYRFKVLDEGNFWW